MALIEGVIFDVDGTLVASNDAHARAWVAALQNHGITVPFEQVRRLIGMGGDHLLPLVAQISEESSQGKQISAERSAIFNRDELPKLKPTPAARELVERLRADGFKLEVASSSKREDLEPLLSVAGIENMLQSRTSSDDAASSKPDPDIVQAALARLQLPAERVVMLGDTPYDLESAARAGVALIAFRSGGWQAADLAGALAIYADPADLLAHYEQSVFASEPEHSSQA